MLFTTFLARSLIITREFALFGDTRLNIDGFSLPDRWEASDALRKKLEQSGMKLQGAAGGWAEMYRVIRECQVIS
jgi:hypothetical protein